MSSRATDLVQAHILLLLRTFRSLGLLIGQCLSVASRDLATLILEVMALVINTGLRAPSVYQF